MSVYIYGVQRGDLVEVYTVRGASSQPHLSALVKMKMHTQPGCPQVDE